MKLRGLIRGAALAVVVVTASSWFAPRAMARSHVSVGIGISVPGVVVDASNCWRCGYLPPPGYYQPAYAAPVYYPVPVYYAPRPVYYSYGYYAPYYYPHRYHHRGYYRDRGWHHRGGHHRHGHR